MVIRQETGLVLSRESGKARLAAVLRSNERLTIPGLREILVAASDAGVSDITLQTDEPPRLLVDGRLYRLGDTRWSAADMEMALSEIYQAANAGVEIRSRKTLDFAYEIRKPDHSRHRFRVNATGIEAAGGYGMELSLRSMPGFTPHATDIDLTPDIIDAMTPANGLVVIAGPTGSGKSTTLAALVRHHFENTACPRKIIDLQSPVEFTFHDLKSGMLDSPSIISQSEIGKHVLSYAEGIRSALRRNPDIIIIGEARDPETISAAINASLTGHLVYTTTHANTVGECISRLLHGVSPDQYSRVAYDMAHVLRMAMTQQLVSPDSDSGRQAMRSYVRLDESIRLQLLNTRPWKWPDILDQHLRNATGGNRGTIATHRPDGSSPLPATGPAERHQPSGDGAGTVH